MYLTWFYTNLVLDIDELLVDEQGRSQSPFCSTHFFPLKYVPLGHEQPSTLVPRQHLSFATGHSSFISQAEGMVMFASYPPLFAQGRQQGSSVKIWTKFMLIVREILN